MDAALRHLERAETSREVREVLRRVQPRHGVSEALVEAVIIRAAKTPERARRVARWWRVFLREGDDKAQAFRLKSLLHRLDGKWELAAESALEAARRAGRGARARRFQLGAVDALARAGKASDAVRLGRSLLRQLEQSGDIEQAARVRLNVGNALLWQDRYAEAEQMYREAEPVLSRAGRGLEAAAAGLGLSACFLFGGKPADALTAAMRARELFLSAGASFHALLAEVNALQARSLLGAPDQAMRRLREILAEFEESSPADAARTEEFLGDALLRLNLWSEAKECFESALRRPALRSMPLNQANCRFGVARACLYLGDHRAAVRHFTRAYRLYLDVNNVPWAAAAATGAAEAHLEKGEQGKATEWVRVALRLLRRRRSPRIESHANLVAVQCTRSRAALQQAQELVRRYALLDMRWRVEAAHAHLLPTHALRHYRKMFDAMLEARLLVSSKIARTAFFRDKEDAIKEYLAVLLKKASPKSIREALDVVTRSRSLTLIDEILSVGGGVIENKELRRLNDLRRRLSGSSGDTPGSRAVLAVPSAVSGQEWTEIVSTLSLRSSKPPKKMRANGTVVVETTLGAFAIVEERAMRLGREETAWAAELDWLSFDLLAPTVDREASVDDCLRALERFATLVSPALGTAAVSPSGPFWRVPWQALAALFDYCEPVVLHSPAFYADAASDRLPRNPRVAIWAGRSEDLPGVASEVAALRAIYPRAKVLWTLKEVQRCLCDEEFDLLHIVGHAMVCTENPMFSRLEFPDGPLFAVEIASSSLRVGGVVLAACDTGQAPLWSLSEPDGLARAFLACGARWAIASQWALDDVAGTLFTSVLHRELRNGGPAGEALRAARLETRRRYAHPYYWAPMFLLGGYVR